VDRSDSHIAAAGAAITRLVARDRVRREVPTQRLGDSIADANSPRTTRRPKAGWAEHSGADDMRTTWFIFVYLGEMMATRSHRTPARFTVSIPREDHDRLARIATENHVGLNTLVAQAVRGFLEKADSAGTVVLKLRNPKSGGSAHGRS
jgi:hypothetical protein